MSLTPTADRLRIDAQEKVLVRPLFAAAIPLDGLLPAMTRPAGIAKGRITAIDTAAAAGVPGIVRVFTHEDFAGVRITPATLGGNHLGFQPLTGTDVVFRGQPVALVVAVTLEAAAEAARLVDVTYEAAPVTATMDEPGAEPQPYETVVEAGDAEAALAAAAVTVDVRYRHPPNIRKRARRDGSRAIRRREAPDSSKSETSQVPILEVGAVATIIESLRFSGYRTQRNCSEAAADFVGCVR